MALLLFLSVFQLHSLNPGPNGKATYAWPCLQSGEWFVGFLGVLPPPQLYP